MVDALLQILVGVFFIAFGTLIFWVFGSTDLKTEIRVVIKTPEGKQSPIYRISPIWRLIAGLAILTGLGMVGQTVYKSLF